MTGVQSWLAEQWSKSNILSGLLAVGIWGVILYLSVIGEEPPDVLIGAGGIIIGYFFKSKSS